MVATWRNVSFNTCARVSVSVSHPRVKHLSVVCPSPNSCEQRQTTCL